MKALLNFKIVPPLDNYPRIVQLVETPFGKLLNWLLFSCFLFLLDPSKCFILSVFLAFFTFWPEQKRVILIVATALYLSLGFGDLQWPDITRFLQMSGAPPWLITPQFAFLTVGSVLLTCALIVHLAGTSFLAHRIRRPVGLVVVLYSLSLCGASFIPLPRVFGAVVWVWLAIFGSYLWYLCYSLQDCKFRNKSPFFQQLGHYYPFWHAANLPVPKGAVYINQIEAKNAHAFAVSQLKGLKLIIWAFWISLLGKICGTLLYGNYGAVPGALRFWQDMHGIHLFFNNKLITTIMSSPMNFGLNTYEQAFNLALTGNPLSPQGNWLSVISGFMFEILNLAVMGHFFIALCRMCGFNALRNTYKPLYSQSIAEFWNRYFYYYKELLVEFFFYPTFFRYFKKTPKLRLYCATLAAACFGNTLFHFLEDIGYIINNGFFRAAASFHVFFIYSLILAHGIFFSQLWQEKRKKRHRGPLTKVLSSIWVLTFFCLLSMFGNPVHRNDLVDFVPFLQALSGM